MECVSFVRLLTGQSIAHSSQDARHRRVKAMLKIGNPLTTTQPTASSQQTRMQTEEVAVNTAQGSIMGFTGVSPDARVG
jgi:hypothetical protein